MKCKLLHNNNVVYFNLKLGKYDNIIDFLNINYISFVAKSEIDFSKLPRKYHGRGKSRNIYEYLSNNNDDPKLINNFLDYYFNDKLKISQDNDEKINFYLSSGDSWANIKVYALEYPNIPKTTTTTTTSEPITTTTTILTTSTTTTTIAPTTTTTTLGPTTLAPTTTTTTSEPYVPGKYVETIFVHFPNLI